MLTLLLDKVTTLGEVSEAEYVCFWELKAASRLIDLHASDTGLKLFATLSIKSSYHLMGTLIWYY